MDPSFILSAPKPSKAEREMLKILQGGAGRGAEKNLAAIDRFNKRSTRYRICPTYADPSPGRTDDLLAKATELGVEAFGVESKVEEAVKELDQSDKTPIVLQIDRAADIARTLAATKDVPRVVFVYLLMKQSSGEFTGLRLYLRPDRLEERTLAEKFFVRLGEITLPGGSNELLGEGAETQDLAREPLYRAWFAEHLTKNLPKAVAGLEPECAPFEITTDGRTTSTLHLVQNDTLRDPIALATEITRTTSTPLKKGRDFVLGEFTPEGVRLSTMRIRKTDGKLSLRGTMVPEARANEPVESRDDDRDDDAPDVGGGDGTAPTTTPSRGPTETLARTLSVTNPVQTTD